MSAQVSWAVFYSSQQPSQIGPTADFDGAAIPPPIFSKRVTLKVCPPIAIGSSGIHWKQTKSSITVQICLQTRKDVRFKSSLP